MIWEIRDVGWPIPYRNIQPTYNYDILTKEEYVWYNPQKNNPLYGPNWFHYDNYKGQQISTWV